MSGGGAQVFTIGNDTRDGGGSLITETDDTVVSVAGSFTHITLNSTSYPTVGHSPAFQLDQMVAVHGTVDEGEDADFGDRLSYNWNELEDLFVVTMDGDIKAVELESTTFGILTAGSNSLATEDEDESKTNNDHATDIYNLDFDLSYDINGDISATISMDFTQTVLNLDWENDLYKYNWGFYEALDCTFRFTREDDSVVEETYRVVFTMGPRSGSFQQANGDGANNIFLISRVKNSETVAGNTHNENRKIDAQMNQGGADIIFADNDASDTGDLWVMPGVNARIVGSINSETTISFNTGTPKYKSVEIALGEPGEWSTATMYDSGAAHTDGTRIGEMYLLNVTGLAAAQQGGNIMVGNSQMNRFYSYNGYGDTSYKHDEFFGMDGDDSMGGDQSVQWVDGGNGNDMYETKWDAVGSAYMSVDFEENEDKDPGSTDPEIPDGAGWVAVSYHKADGSPDDATSPIDYLYDVESITGGRGHPDLMYGNGEDNIFLGLAGENILHGRDGDDTLIVDEDYISGDNYSDGFSFLQVDGGAGFDKIWLNGDSPVINVSELLAGASITNIEKIDLSQLWTSYIRDLLIDSSDYTNRWTSARELQLIVSNVIAITDEDNILFVDGDAGDYVFLPASEGWTEEISDQPGYDKFVHPGGEEIIYIEGDMSSPLLSLDNDDLVNNSIRMFPNPASDFVTLRFTDLQNEKMTVSLYDISGRLVMKEQKSDSQSELRMNISSLSSGLYLMKIYNETGGERTKKLMIK